jgi:hypothetical protein
MTGMIDTYLGHPSLTLAVNARVGRLGNMTSINLSLSKWSGFQIIQSGKFTKELLRSIIVGFSRVNFFVELTKKDSLAIMSNVCAPSLVALVKVYALVVTTLIRDASFSISGIFGLSRKTQIASTVIKRIAIDMINNLVSGSIHDCSVHVYRLLSTVSGFTWFISGDALATLANAKPLPLIQPFVISVVNNRNLALC